MASGGIWWQLTQIYQELVWSACLTILVSCTPLEQLERCQKSVLHMTNDRLQMVPHFEYGMPACSPNLVADINYLERFQR